MEGVSGTRSGLCLGHPMRGASQHQSLGVRLALILGQILKKELQEAQPESTVTLRLAASELGRGVNPEGFPK